MHLGKINIAAEREFWSTDFYLNVHPGVVFPQEFLMRDYGNRETVRKGEKASVNVRLFCFYETVKSYMASTL